MNNNPYTLPGKNPGDVQAVVTGSANVNTYSWTDGVMTASDEHIVGKAATADANAYTVNRMYLHFNMPALPKNARIKNAELVFYQKASVNDQNVFPKLGLSHVTQDISTGSATPAQDARLLDFAVIHGTDSNSAEPQSYRFDITRLADMVNRGESAYRNLAVEMPDAPDGDCNITLYGGTDATYAPAIYVTYEPGYAVNSPYRTHTHGLGRFGQGNVDLVSGNLMFEAQDFAWAGGRMPVTLKHLYNSALGAYPYTRNTAIELETADFSAMKLGFGWKLNVMQSMKAVSFTHDGTLYDGYIYMGENNDAIWFKPVDGEENVFEAIQDSSLRYHSANRTLEQGSDMYLFDDAGRLIRITDEHGSCVAITYTDNRITKVTDGVGREFALAYSGDDLVSITAPDETSVVYEYANGLLTGVTYPDNTKAVITYTGNEVSCVAITDANKEGIYSVHYTFENGRVMTVDERGEGGKQGAVTSYARSAAERTVSVQTTEPADTDEGETSGHSITTVYTFNDDGDITSEYVYGQDLKNVPVSGSNDGIHPYHGNAVGTLPTCHNLFGGHNLESDESASFVDGKGLHGCKALCIRSDDSENREKAAYQPLWLNAGSYTLSAYMRFERDAVHEPLGAYIRAVDEDGNVLARSEYLSQTDTEYVRLVETFEVETARTVYMQFLLDGAGTVYADALQLEANSFAIPYNILENGSIERGNWKWTMTDGVEYTEETQVNMPNCLKMTGDLDAVRNATQSVIIRPERSTRETFTLFGWAKACAIPNHERDGGNEPQFRLRAVIHYNDADYEGTSTETFTADFSPLHRGVAVYLPSVHQEQVPHCGSCGSVLRLRLQLRRGLFR